MSKRKLRLGISACLLGRPVRYDGRDKLDAQLAGIPADEVEWVPVCPEVEFGLPVPREPIRLEGNPAAPELRSVQTRRKLTAAMREFCRRRVRELGPLDGFVFKRNSPSCGRNVPVYAADGSVAGYAPGFFAAAWKELHPALPAAEAEELHDETARNEFFARLNEITSLPSEPEPEPKPESEPGSGKA